MYVFQILIVMSTFSRVCAFLKNVDLINNRLVIVFSSFKFSKKFLFMLLRFFFFFVLSVIPLKTKNRFSENSHCKFIPFLLVYILRSIKADSKVWSPVVV